MHKSIQIEVFPNHTMVTEPERVHRRAVPTYRIGSDVIFYVLRNRDTRMTNERRRAAEMAAMIYAQDNHMAVSQLKRYMPEKKCGCGKRKSSDPRNYMDELL